MICYKGMYQYLAINIYHQIYISSSRFFLFFQFLPTLALRLPRQRFANFHCKNNAVGRYQEHQSIAIIVDHFAEISVGEPFAQLLVLFSCGVFEDSHGAGLHHCQEVVVALRDVGYLVDGVGAVVEYLEGFPVEFAAI